MTVNDQLGRKLSVNGSPKRIISLVPSITELLHYFGLDEYVVGVTNFCVHPTSWRKNKSRLGGTKDPDLARIKTLKPDLIICNKEENRKEDVLNLAEEFPVYISDVKTIQDAQNLIADIGSICDVCDRSVDLNEQITVQLNRLSANLFPKITVSYIIWNDPIFTIAHGTFIFNMLQLVRLEQLSYPSKTNYPQVTQQQLSQSKPELILLSSEPYPFKNLHLKKWKAKFPESKVLRVDGEYCSWYGSRMLSGMKYLEDLRNKIDNLHLA